MENVTPDDVIILKPDLSLKKKLGEGVSFDQVVTEQKIAHAQELIHNAAEATLAQVTQDLAALRKHFHDLQATQDHDTYMPAVIKSAFAIKAMAGMCGYDFASSLAQTLFEYCESGAVAGQPPSRKTLLIMQALIDGLTRVFNDRITGDGGPTGAVILAELHKLFDISPL